MHYTISAEALRNLASEFAEDLSNTYENLNAEGISLSDLQYWEQRRAALLHMRERAFGFAKDIEVLNRLHQDRMDDQVWVREAAE
jgi:hypothetical protein